VLYATAALADALPPGWSAQPDGALAHGSSGATCPLALSGFNRMTIESKGAPDLGICTYAGDNGREGLIRVRQYVRGAGETPLAIQNDQMLMEPPSGGRQIASAIRSGPGPEKNGSKTQQFVLTIARNGLLIDCIGRWLQSDDSEIGSDFALACLQQQRA